MVNTQRLVPGWVGGVEMYQLLDQRSGVEVIGMARGEEDTANPGNGALSGPLLFVGQVVVEV